MAAQPNTQPRQQRETVDFPPNVPITVSLKYGTPRTVGGMNGERFMYSLQDGRVMFLDPPVAAQIAELGLNVRESFTITKTWDGHRETPATWTVARIGEQRDGTLVVPKLPPSPAAHSTGAAATANPPASAAAASSEGGRPHASAALVDEANCLVDSYAVVLERALRTYEGRVKPDEVRGLLISAYIQRRQLSSVA